MQYAATGFKGGMSLTRLTLALVSILLASSFAASSVADICPPDRSHGTSSGNNPIRLEGQIREITIGEDARNGDDVQNITVAIRLHRDRYPIIATNATRVRWLDGPRALATDLQVGDSIRVEGNLERNEILADRITILLRIERRSTH